MSQPPDRVKPQSSQWVRRLVLLGILAAGCSPAVADEKPPQPQEVAELVQQLDHDQFSVRQGAHRRLLDMGEPALPLLTMWVRKLDAARRAAAGAPRESAERRKRLRSIIDVIHETAMRKAFAELGRQADDEVDFEHAMWLIARIGNPAVQRSDLTRQLDDLAAKVRKRIGDRKPEQLPPQKAVEIVCTVLFKEHGLQGAQTNYDHPDNSSLEIVLKKKRGLPILLSHIVVAVADRLDLPFVGIPVPSRYMVKYDGDRAPPGSPSDDIIIDAFGGKSLTLAELQELVPAADLDDLEPSSRKETVVRMLRNLSSDFSVQGEIGKARQVDRYSFLVDSRP